MPALLDIRNLTVRFPGKDGDQAVVDHLSVSIQPGSITALVGESGSGKSVTSLAILNLLPAQARISGEIFFHRPETTADLLKQTEEGLRTIRGNRISMIFQEPMTSLNPLMTCGRQVMESLQLHQHLSRKEARHAAIEWFRQVELPDPESMADRYPHQLSGGQKQRVMIAMAMCNNPSLLIADEPTTALDVRVQKNIMELIKRLQAKTGMSVLLITHDLGLVADIADDIAVMYRGQLTEQGPARQILRSPQSAYTKALLACRPMGHPRNSRLPVIGDFLENNGKEQTKILPDPDHQQKTKDKERPLLSVRDLNVDIRGRKTSWTGKPGTKRIIDQVSFDIDQGAIMGLVGESGCGKTTLGRAILQLIKPTSGTVLLNGTDLSTLDKNKLRATRKELQVVFQDPYGSLNPKISIGNALMEPMLVHHLASTAKEARDKAAALLGTVQLETYHLNRYPHQFSGGQRQRICIARALALEPRFMIFDESVSALDVSVQAQILNLINDLKRKLNLTALFISHDLSVVRFISDHILVMKDGRIIESGPSEDLMEHPINQYTRELIQAIPGKSLFT